MVKSKIKFSPKIAYIVPGLDISGGIAIILQHANHLMKRGHDVTLLNFDSPVEEINWFHNEVPITNVKGGIVSDFFDIVIATHYSTVKYAKKVKSERKIYFVQSDERRFNVDSAEAIEECETSYREKFEYMTEAIWIQRWLKEEFGHDAYYVPNGLDSEIIHKVKPLQEKSDKIRVLLEGPIAIPWKGMNDAYNAVKDLNCEIWIVSSNGKPKGDWRYDKFFESVPLHKMKEIYSSCDIFLKMSRVEGFFGPPMEAMACGCSVVVGKVTGYDEYIKNGHNALVVEQGDIDGAKKAVQRLIDDKSLREKLIANGFETASQWNWERSIDLLEKMIGGEAVEKFYTEDFPEKYNYNGVIKPILMNLVKNINPIVRQKDQELQEQSQMIQQKNQEIQQKEQEIDFIKSSKFWKIRERYVKLRGLSSAYFINLAKKALMVLKRDGIFVFARYLYKYLIHGRAYFAKKGGYMLPGQPDAWARYRKTFNQELRPLVMQKIVEMTAKPLISILVPTYNTPETMLREMIASVQSQLYPNWELCIADDGSSQPHVKKTLKEFASKDPRIKVNFSTENRGVSHVSNLALKMATGDFVILLDHDDILEEQALFRVAESVLEDNPDMIYSDEVLVTPDANTVTQYVYRPAFSREFLRGHPYIVHMVGFRKQLLEEIGGFNEELNISQDYDLILRASEQAQVIVHIPEILYRWRIHGNSAGHQKMDQVMTTSKAILQNHLERCGDTGIVNDGYGFNMFDVRYSLNNKLKVAIIIPTKNHGDLVRKCIESMRSTISEIKYDIVVVDHESDDPSTRAYLTSISQNVRILRYKGIFNFSAINNWAVSQIGGNYSHYLFCNNDIEAINPGWLERMLELGQQSSVGVVGAKLLYPDRKTVQHAGVCVGAFDRAEHYGKFLKLPTNGTELGYFYSLVINHEVAAVTAACLLIRKEVFEEVSGFDETLAVGFGDVDLCLRVGDHGYRILLCPYAELVHHESYTRGVSQEDNHPKDTALYKSKWKSLLQAGDPYYNPGLSLESTTWKIKYPLNCTFNIRRRIVRRDKNNGKERSSFN